MKARIDHAILADPPKRAESFMKGSTVVKFTVSESGALESVSTEQATSPEFAQYAVRLVSSLAPFEPFSAEMKKRTDRIEVVTRIEY
ncbi:energy transducer TonB [Ramlibacter humi]|nr:energy transducer TonB [Ramlibacter humi]